MGLLLLPAIAGCTDGEKFERLPLQVVALEFADTLRFGQRDVLVVGAEVGYAGCELENGGLERRGDTLYVRGNARCRVVQYFDSERVLGPRLKSPPARSKPQWLRFELPELEPGAYVLAGGRLRDTLIVAAQDVPSSSQRFVGLGTVWPDSLVCPGLAAIFDLYLFRDAYQVLDFPPSEGPVEVEIHATHAGAATCDSISIPTLRLRSVTWLKPR